MRRFLSSLVFVFALLTPLAAQADNTSIVDLNGATPTPTTDPSTSTPDPTATVTPTTTMPVTGSPAELPFILLALMGTTGYVYLRYRRQE